MEKIILLVTHKKAFEADLIVQLARDKSIPFIRFNQDDYPKRINIDCFFQNGKVYANFELPKKTFSSDQIGIAWYQQSYEYDVSNNIGTEALKNREVKSFLDGLWYSLEIHWFNSPHNVKSSNKLRQLKFAQSVGLKIPNTLISNSKDAILEFYRTSSDKLIFKTIDTQIIELDGKQYASYTREIDANVLKVLDRAVVSPTLFQNKIDKIFELRVIFIDNMIFSAKINSQSNESTSLDWRNDPNLTQNSIEKYELPKNIQEKIHQLMNLLNLRFGAIDLIVTPKLEYIFLEVNSTPSWNWTQIATGYPIGEFIMETLAKNLKI